MPMPKTIKLVLKGKFPFKEKYQLPDGEIVDIQNYKYRVVPSKKNDQILSVITRKNDDGTVSHIPTTRPSAQHQKWIIDTAPEFKEFYRRILEDHNVRLPIYRAKIKVLFYFSTSGEKDLSNKFETIADALVDHKILINDDFKVLKPNLTDGWVDRSNPRTEIYISILNAQTSEKEYGWDVTPPEHAKFLKEIKNTRKRLKRLGAVKV